jgi:hypothetical protein
MALVVFWDSLSGVNPWFFGGTCLSVDLSVSLCSSGGADNLKNPIGPNLAKILVQFLRGLRGWSSSANNWCAQGRNCEGSTCAGTCLRVFAAKCTVRYVKLLRRQRYQGPGDSIAS